MLAWALVPWLNLAAVYVAGAAEWAGASPGRQRPVSASPARPATLSSSAPLPGAREQENPTVVTLWFGIPQMSSRHGVRAISASVSDVPGVRTVQAHLDSMTLIVTGTADAAAVQTAIRRAGYEAIILSNRPKSDGAAGSTAGAMEVER
jgi:copper chaperone